MLCSRVMRKPVCFGYAKVKSQISCAVTAQLISAFILTSMDSTNPLHFNPINVFSSCTGRFVSNLVGKYDDRFSHDTAYESGGTAQVVFVVIFSNF